jgi:RNA polymerase sigma factor for flagellar operon FliA
LKNAIEPLPWSEEVRDRDTTERDRFLESHLELVRYLALRFAARLPASVEIDELVHDGIVGLIDATERFDPRRGVRFRTYAETRIRGAILDGLRQKDWRPRSVRQLQRPIDTTLAELHSVHHRTATEEEIAAALGIGIDEYHTHLIDLASGPLLSIDELPPTLEPPVSESTQRPDAPFEHEELIRSLALEITRLPERERTVLELYYAEQLNMKEVGAVLGVTESRVCQLHSQAAARLRVALTARLHVAPRSLAAAGR